MSHDPRLVEFAITDHQRKVIELLLAGNSHRAIGQALGASHKNVNRIVQVVRKRAAAGGVAPGHFDHGVAPGYRMGKVTVQRTGDGEVERVWERQHPSHSEQREAIEQYISDLVAGVPRIEPTPPPAMASDELLNLYTLTDCHVGMLAWHKEGGEDWDLRIAQATLSGCFKDMVQRSRPAKTGVVAVLGDFLHYDGLTSVTPRGGHVLDADGRFGKMVQVALDILRDIVSFALDHHERVILLIAEGNHDIASSVWMRRLFGALYEREPRIEVIQSEKPYYAIRHGSVMICWHHGHLKKLEGLPLLMASEFPEIWGQTTKRYCHAGDKHHLDVKDYSGIRVHQHPTLAARDAYASRNGWHALREASAITYHALHGRVGEVVVAPEMAEDGSAQ